MAKKSTKGAGKSAPDEKPSFSLISNATLLALYGDLRACKKAARRKAFDALPAGIMMDLAKGDALASDVADATIRLKRKGKPAAGSDLSAVLGAAFLHKQRKTGKVGVIFGADLNSPDWTDALALAKDHWLPLIFVSRAEGPDEKALRRELAKPRKKKKKAAKPEGYLPRMIVDANDVVAVYRVAHEAIDRARRGRGATWIEGVPFRVEGKRGVPDAVASMEKYLQGKGLM
jgi:TPP-dependent pyruvate/acetoin dehydrogenase alpha subunit